MSEPAEAPANPKLCKNCKFYELGKGALIPNDVHWCLSPHNGVNVVTGDMVKNHAEYQRAGRLDRHCGLEARFYQEAEVKAPPPSTRKTIKARH